MSNTQRPSLAPKHTTKTEKKREAEADVGVVISVDGTTYTVREADLTSLDTMALRRETGMSFIGLMQAFGESPDIDLIAALVWLARRSEGERMLAYADVAKDINYQSDFDVEPVETPDADPQT